MVFTSKWTIFSPGIQWEGSLGSWKSVLYEKIEKYIRISKFLKFLDFWILDSAWSLTHDCTFLVMESLRHNPCEVTLKISAHLGHQYCIYQGPLTQMWSWDPLTIRVKINIWKSLNNWFCRYLTPPTSQIGTHVCGRRLCPQCLGGLTEIYAH